MRFNAYNSQAEPGGIIYKDDDSAITHSSIDSVHRIKQGNTTIVTSMPDWSIFVVAG